jgi:hypothetical protein
VFVTCSFVISAEAPILVPCLGVKVSDLSASFIYCGYRGFEIFVAANKLRDH